MNREAGADWAEDRERYGMMQPEVTRMDKKKSTKQQRDVVIEHIDNIPFPTLGNKNTKYDVKLTEPEVHAIHAAMGFVRSACREAPFPKFWNHYGPTLEALSQRLFEETE